MCRTFGKKSAKILLSTLCLALLGAGQAFSKPKSELVKEEEGFYYGYGKGSTPEESAVLAKKDLIETALTTNLRLTNKKAQRVTVSDENVSERLTNIKAFCPNPKNQLNQVCKVSIKDWEKDDKAFDEKLRKTLTPKYQTITVKGSAGTKLDTAAEILSILESKGETHFLTLQAGGTELFSAKVEGVCQSIINNLSLTFTQKNGIVSPETEFAVTAADNAGSPVSNLKLKAVWSVAELPVTVAGDEIAEVVSIVTTDADGKAVISYPMSEEYLNKTVCLTVSTALSIVENATSAMRKIDGASSAEARYAYYTNLEETFLSAAVEAGEYMTGKVEQDKRAALKEKERTVALEAFNIDVNPVTNIQYASYLYLTEADSYPEYFDNSDYNQENQPVTGVTAADAEAYAAWLSEQTGKKYRLPTDDEWEVAAHAGASTIYPWGDQDPVKAGAANCKGNSSYKTLAPAGSFMAGTNAWGLVDMSGNVWEWTSTARDTEEGFRTVKGGSWMDGPADLRISNYKNIDAEVGGPDIGFRLVKENN